jgi:hypothetical protein
MSLPVSLSTKLVSVSSFAPVECVEGWSWDAKDAKSYSRSLGWEKMNYVENVSLCWLWILCVCVCVCVEEVCFTLGRVLVLTRRECCQHGPSVIAGRICGNSSGTGKWYICGCYWTIHCGSGQTLWKSLEFEGCHLQSLLQYLSIICSELKNCGGWFWLAGFVWLRANCVWVLLAETELIRRCTPT